MSHISSHRRRVLCETRRRSWEATLANGERRKHHYLRRRERAPHTPPPPPPPLLGLKAAGTGEITRFGTVPAALISAANNEQEVEARGSCGEGGEIMCQRARAHDQHCCDKPKSCGLTDADCRSTGLESQLLSFISHWIYSALFRFHLQIDRRSASRCKEKL